jgi:type IV pilus assembly protein PilB
MAVKAGRFLGESLIADKVVTREQLEFALKEAKVRRELLGQALIRLGWATADQISMALARQAGVEVVDLDSAGLDADLIRTFPESLLRANKVLPLRRDGHTLTAATSDIGNLAGVDELRRHSNLFVTLVAAREDEIVKHLDRIFARAGGAAAAAGEIEPVVLTTAQYTAAAAGWTVPGSAPRTTQAAPAADDRPATMVVDELLKKAVNEGASDIHIEPTETSIVTRFRYDGMLRQGPTLPRALSSAVLTRIKILSELNIAENRLPQDGRMMHEIGDRKLDLRVSVFPTIHGEKVAIRVLDKTRTFGLETLGLTPQEMATFKRCITKPHGLFLVTGPTGSGKTTTLYSALKEINTVEKNICTLEDPVEYELEGIRQTQVNPRAGLTFAVGLRALLRQDPDVILVGEMRDLETVEIAIRAAMTGHLVFSTLHTNDALGAMPRLMDMGVPPYLISSSLVGVLAQRLVRLICPICKTKITPQEAEVQRLGDLAAKITAPHKGRGCPNCNGTGYKGRQGVFEMLVPETLRLAAAGVDPEELKRQAIESGALVPMLDQAIGKVNAGQTTVDEVIRSVFSEVGM